MYRTEWSLQQMQAVRQTIARILGLHQGAEQVLEEAYRTYGLIHRELAQAATADSLVTLLRLRQAQPEHYAMLGEILEVESRLRLEDGDPAGGFSYAHKALRLYLEAILDSPQEFFKTYAPKVEALEELLDDAGVGLSAPTKEQLDRFWELEGTMPDRS
ncbi:MAG: hypothetical protein C4328_03035 [Meiothermus sp.]